MKRRQLRWVCPALALVLCSLPQIASAAQDERKPSEWVAALRGDERELAIAALSRLGKPAAGPLARALEDADAELAWQITRTFRALGKQGAQAALPLVAVVRDAKQPVQRRACAAAAIGSFGEAGKGAHLADVLAERTEALQGGSFVTYSDWSTSSAEAIGLVAALQALLAPEFLERARYLELFWEPFNGFRAPTDAHGI